MKILIAEDDKDAAHLLKLILSPYGDADVAEDGLKALELFREALDEDDPYDLVCLDVMMPKMDGTETLRQIRKEEDSRGIGGCLGSKVLMVSACEEDETIHETIVEGCEGYVSKTHGRRKILEKLKELGLIP